MKKLLKIEDPLKLENLLNKELGNNYKINKEDLNSEKINEEQIKEDPTYKKIMKIILEEQKDKLFNNLEKQKEILEEFDLKIFEEIEEIDIDLENHENEINEKMTKMENDFLKIYKNKQIIQKQIDFGCIDKIEKKLGKIEKNLNLKEIKNKEKKLINCEKKINYLDKEFINLLEKNERDSQKIFYDIECIENDIERIQKKQNEEKLEKVKELFENLKNEIEKIINLEKINLEKQTNDSELQDVCLEKLKEDYNDLIIRGDSKLNDLKNILNEFNQKFKKN